MSHASQQIGDQPHALLLRRTARVGLIDQCYLKPLTTPIFFHTPTGTTQIEHQHVESSVIFSLVMINYFTLRSFMGRTGTTW
jgi:hypothetical protein